MKSILLSFALFLGYFSFSQGIKVADLTNFLNKTSVDAVRKPLETKGWVFYQKEQKDNGNVAWVWTYKYNPSNDKAVAWITVYFDGSQPVRAFYEIFDMSLTLPFSTSIYANGFQFEDIGQDDKEFTNRYANKDFYLWEYQNKDYKKGYQFDCVKKFSNEDGRNGTKKSYYDSGALKKVYELRDGMFEGKCTYYYENGNIEQVSNWKEDKEEGLFQFYNKDGIIESDETYKNGYLEGPANFYYPNGKLKSTYMYSFDKKNGEAKEYDEEGNLTTSYQFIGGERFGDYREFVKGQESFKCFYLRGKFDGPYTETLFDENDQPYATVKGSYDEDYLDGTIIAFYLGTKDTLSIRQYKDHKPLGEWRYYDKDGQLSKRVLFADQKAKTMNYYSKGELLETITFLKEDDEYRYFQYLYTGSYSLLANYRITKFELAPNKHEFSSFESETQIYEVDDIADTYFKYGLYLVDDKILTYTGNYNEYNLKTGDWTCLYKSSKITRTETFNDGEVIKEVYANKKGKPYSGKLTYERGGYKYSIEIENGIRNGITEMIDLSDKSKYTAKYVNGTVVE